MTDITHLLHNSSRPLFLLGAGARGAVYDIISFCDMAGIPMETTWNAVDLVPHDHPLFVGRLGIVATRGANKAVQECDLLVAIGARLDEPTIAYDYIKFAPNAVKVLVDIDTGESLKIPNLDMFIKQDAGDFIRSLPVPERITKYDWREQCAEWKQDKLIGDTLTYSLLDGLSDHLPDEAVIVMDCGCQSVNIFCAGFRNKQGQRYIMSSCGLGSMGAALPVAVGAAIASSRQVFVISGDGSFMQNIQELETIHRLNLPITVFVINNGGYASIRNSETRAFGRTKSGESIPNIKDVVQAFGVKALGMPRAFLFNWKLLEAREPQVIVFDAPIDEVPLPRVMFDGKGNLENMYPYV